MHPTPFSDPALLKALCAFTDELAQLPDPRDAIRWPCSWARCSWPWTGADTMAAVAWFRMSRNLWLPLDQTVPTDDTYRLLMRQLEPETAIQAALLLLDGICLPDLRKLILALDGRVARRSGTLPRARGPYSWSAPSWCGRG